MGIKHVGKKKILEGEGEKNSKAFAPGSKALNPGSIVGPCSVRAYGTLPILDHNLEISSMSLLHFPPFIQKLDKIVKKLTTEHKALSTPAAQRQAVETLLADPSTRAETSTMNLEYAPSFFHLLFPPILSFPMLWSIALVMISQYHSLIRAACLSPTCTGNFALLRSDYSTNSFRYVRGPSIKMIMRYFPPALHPFRSLY